MQPGVLGLLAGVLSDLGVWLWLVAMHPPWAIRRCAEALEVAAEGAREIEVDINGWVWVVMVERYGRNLKFASEAYSISGASRTQLLAGPYAPLRTSLNNAPITAMQAATDELLYTGFTLNWDAANVGPADWTFPAGYTIRREVLRGMSPNAVYSW